jgi:hypothetical protein
MPTAQILDVRGVEVEIRAWRHRSNLYEAHFTDKAGNPIALDNMNAVMVIYDRVGGTNKFTQTNNPANHINAAGGISRFLVPASTFAALTQLRAYTWKHEIYLLDLDTMQPQTHFWGDFRVMPPQTA